LRRCRVGEVAVIVRPHAETVADSLLTAHMRANDIGRGRNDRSDRFQLMFAACDVAANRS